FTSLAMALPGHGVLLVGTTRPGVSKDWLAGIARLDQTSQLALDRLGPQDLEPLLREMLPSEDVARELGSQIATKSDGNPFFVFEILRGLREGHFIRQTHVGTWVGNTRIEKIEIPSSLLELVNARVSDLSEDERDLLDLACCAGFAFDPALVGDVLGLGRIATLKRFGRIEREHRLVRSAGRNYVFDHHQVQEALYGALHEQLREEYHGALGGALEDRLQDASPDDATAVELCEHYLRGGRGADALRFLRPAQEHLTRTYEHARVIDISERALALPGLLTGAERARVLLALQPALDFALHRSRQEECVREARKLAEDAGDAQLRSEAASALGQFLRLTGRADESLTVLQEALAEAVDRSDRVDEGKILGRIGNALGALGRSVEACEHFERQLSVCRELGDRPAEARATVNLATSLTPQGRMRESRDLLERGEVLGREVGDRQAEATAIGGLGNLCFHEGRLDEARQGMTRALAVYREIGDRHSEARVIAGLGHVLYAEDRLEEARQHFERRLALSREIGDREGEMQATGNLGSVLHDEGDLDAARRTYDRHLALAEKLGDRSQVGVAAHSKGRLLEDLGDPVGAREQYGKCLEVLLEVGFRRGTVPARRRLAAVHAELGEVDRARVLW
ncbi:MAG: tetratricopeptide repeat protein, partial [bacterium]|nr:tetratricopeptide repeat protein [bacterium]